MNRAWLMAFVAVLAAAGLSSRMHPNRYREGRSRDPLARVEVNQSSLARILGEFRTGMSDMLFIKTERYLHSGVGYVPHLTEKLLTVEGTDQGVDEHLEEMEEEEGPGHMHGQAHRHGGEDHDHFHHDGDVETLLPTAEGDYRGWIGRMHREVKPWRDPALAHRHTDGKELIPWFRMMTVSDPGYIRGYVVGAFWLRRHSLDAALEFIREGQAANPDAFQLYLSEGFLLVQRARSLADKGVLSADDSGQLEILLTAKTAFQRAAELMVTRRPEEPAEGDISDLPGWGTYLETDAMAASEMAVHFEARYGNPERAEMLRRRYLGVMPDHPRLRQ